MRECSARSEKPGLLGLGAGQREWKNRCSQDHQKSQNGRRILQLSGFAGRLVAISVLLARMASLMAAIVLLVLVDGPNYVGSQ